MTIPTFIVTEQQLKSELGKLTQGYSSIAIITDSNVAEHVLPLLITSCEALAQAEVVELEPGEESKDLSIATQVYEAFLEMSLDRRSLILAVGGGVVTDFGAFVASTYKRGIDFVLVPTSLLAMVDAALGGKTGVDVGLVKNAVGTFTHAMSTVIYPSFLHSLPEDELNSGFAEMLKHAAIADRSLFDEMGDLDSFDAEALIPYIQKSAAIKMEIVLQDPLENGKRKLLNFGHTIGHAVESTCLSRQMPISHGVAVALGMLVEADVAVRCFGLQEEAYTELRNVLLVHFDFAFALQLNFSDMLPFLLNDKKNESGQVYVVKLLKLGKADLPGAVEIQDLKGSWERIQHLIA